MILDALRTAHAARVVHRDIKPSNIMFDRGRAMVTDFGIARMEEDTVLTRTGALIGTPAYMAPEQARGLPATPASDLWSFGATLYAAVEGRPPFAGPNVTAVLAALLTEEPARPRRAGGLAPLLTGLLVKDPARRMAADAVSAGLTTIAAGRTPPSAPDRKPAPGFLATMRAAFRGE